MNDKILITSEYPTYIVEDFKIFLSYLTSHQLKLTKSNGYFTKKDLIATYSSMHLGKREIPQHATQTGYPLIHLFYHLSVALDLLIVNRTKSGAIGIVQNQRIDEFMKLTATEQYVTLLETFWVEVDWEELQGEKWGVAPNNVDFLFEELESFPAEQVLQLKKYKEIENQVSRYGQFFDYFSYFGFWTFEVDSIKSNDPERPKSTIAKSITLTALFKKIQHSLLETWNPHEFGMTAQSFNKIAEFLNLPFEMEEEEVEEDKSAESLVDLLRPLFPEGELTNVLTKTQQASVEGTYLFKVKLNLSCWRTLQLSSSHTLLDLHELIQQAFCFDDDHLYAFYMDGKKFGKRCYNSPMDDQGPYVNEVEVGSLNLFVGRNFLYLFDFGDEWEFDVQVLRIIEGEEHTEPSIREEHGEAPTQYYW